ncbi:ABC transporter permease [Lihuaxuella thermophila]|uniref:ABC-2 type transport system permease protein n=1 Tax=Lihuaxuella thermophila TaxID=1173111 RepID=A0A1H8FET3_9BACL|nr:ABC-2 family transporter protein [Lihuaxuella thermophila]SEN30253.1 ABC-2 type transport system permease protein [Lihuaxuella thermophila]
MSTVAKYIRFALACWKLNLAGAMEFRLSFFMTAGMMIINNFVWIFFWQIYFHRFKLVNGWDVSDVMMLWAVVAGGFGLANVFFGNADYIGNIIVTGQLDTYLAQPKPVLLNLLISRMSVSALGDVIFALLVFGCFGKHTWSGMLKFSIALFLSMLIFVFFSVCVQSLAFYVGHSEGFIGQELLVTFATYPTDIFRGMTKVVLFTVLPAGFISYMPIGLLREVEPLFFGAAIGVVMLLVFGGTALFYRGLRRYGSGNMMGMRM